MSVTLTPSAPGGQTRTLTVTDSGSSFGRGTLNVVIGNGSGIVATDSKTTLQRSARRFEYPAKPAKKLFRLDPTTVCTAEQLEGVPVVSRIP